MKRGGPDHPKMKGLARKLKVPRYSAVGLCELLWHWAAQYALAGDVGRHSDEDIAEAVHWDREPAELIQAMIEVGLLDEIDEHRLIIHDWPEHCEDSVHIKLARKREYFADGQQPKTSRIGKAEREPIDAHYAANPGFDPHAQDTHGTRTAHAPTHAQPAPMPPHASASASASAHENTADLNERESEQTADAPLSNDEQKSRGFARSRSDEKNERRELEDLLLANGVDNPEAKRLVACATPARIREVVEYVRQESDVRNPGGYIRQLIMDNSKDGEITPTGDFVRQINALRQGKRSADRSAS